jgi:peptidoglycan/xylan/chitin deacetylase (PgdA/CDA1 family)
LGAGWEVDSHTIAYPDPTRVDAAQLRQEVAGSRRALKREFRVPTHFSTMK